MDKIKDLYDLAQDMAQGFYPDGSTKGHTEDEVPTTPLDGAVKGHQPEEMNELDYREFKAILERLDMMRVDDEIRLTVVRVLEALNTQQLRFAHIHPGNKALVNDIITYIYNKHYKK